MEQTKTPVLVEGLTQFKVRRIAANNNSACITNDGELFLWGVGSFGQWEKPQKALTNNCCKLVDVSLG